VLECDPGDGKWGDIADWDQRLKKLEAMGIGTQTPIYAGLLRSMIRDVGSRRTVVAYFSSVYTTKKNGTGLGLAIVHSIMENHHGAIKVKSFVNQGTTFEVVLLFNSNIGR